MHSEPASRADGTPFRIHLTGFRPFGKHRTNPSAVIAESIDQSMLEKASSRRVLLQKWVLPVDRDEVTAWIGATSGIETDLILHLGLAERQPCIRLEHAAANRYFDYFASGDGGQTTASRLSEHGPSYLRSNLPFRHVRRRLRLRDVPCTDSYCAGLYACNQVLYESLFRRRSRGSKETIGFVHFPTFKFVPRKLAVCAAVDVIVACIEQVTWSLPAEVIEVSASHLRAEEGTKNHGGEENGPAEVPGCARV